MLRRLIEYAKMEGLDPEPGFTTRAVRWLVEISKDGELINLLPLGNEKRGASTPKCPEMHNMNAGGRAHFLVETAQTIALLFKKNESPKRVSATEDKHRFFAEMIKNASAEISLLQPLALFLADETQLQLLHDRLSHEKAKPADWLRWRVGGGDPLQQENILNWWRSRRERNLRQGESGGGGASKEVKKKLTKGKDEMLCFLSGEALTPLDTQPKITGLSSVGGLGTGDVMAGFDKAAFCSLGLKKARNAAMGAKPVQQYVDALNYLIRNNSKRLANVMVVHWFKETVRPEDDPLAFLYEPPETTEAAALESARQVLESLRDGQRPAPPNNRYYAITISGASGRVMVRDWMEGNFEELAARIGQWFSDLEIVSQGGVRTAPDPRFNNVCLTMVRYDKNKTYLDNLKQLPAPVATRLWRVALASLPIPQPFIVQALARFRADLIADQPFNHARMGLMKAYFIRKGGKNTMNAYLNKEHPDPAYQCGRLLATLAGLQQSALGDVGAGVVQRYYVAASQTPGLIIGRLIANAKNHLNKLDGGLAHWYEDQIAEVMSHVRDNIPATLDLEGQTLFALGYYQQIAANRAGKKGTNNESN